MIAKVAHTYIYILREKCITCAHNSTSRNHRPAFTLLIYVSVYIFTAQEHVAPPIRTYMHCIIHIFMQSHLDCILIIDKCTDAPTGIETLQKPFIDYRIVWKEILYLFFWLISVRCNEYDEIHCILFAVSHNSVIKSNGWSSKIFLKYILKPINNFSIELVWNFQFKNSNK